MCRGAHSSDNSEDYFEVYTGLDSLAACKEQCVSAEVCKGIEYSLENAGRCEVWTRTGGISSVLPVSGFSCLRFRQSFEIVDGVVDGACRGANASDNSPYYYSVHTGVASLSECKERCLGTRPFCTGIEYTSGLGGRCEVWTRAQGVGVVVPMGGFTCLRLRNVFEAVRPSGAQPSAAPTVAPAVPTPAPAMAGVTAEHVLTRGIDHVFSVEKTHDISVVAMTPTTALVCSLLERRGYCSILSMSDGSLKQGPKVGVADQGETTRLSVARLSETTALACYVENGVGPYGRPMPTPTCRVLLVSGTALTRGAPFVLDDEEEVILSMSLVGLSPSLALVCYDRLDDLGLMGVCSAMHVEGGVLRQGGAEEVSAGDIEYGPEIVAARLSDAAALVCYRDQAKEERAACSVFSVAGGQPSRGPALAVSDSHFHSLSAAGLSATEALVCFKDFAARPPQSICKALSASGTGLAEGRRVQVSSGKTSLARLSETTALACSSDTHHTHETACAVLSLHGKGPTKGPDLVLSTTNTGSFYVASGLSPSLGLVCYEDRNHAKAHRGACTSLAVAAASP